MPNAAPMPEETPGRPRHPEEEPSGEPQQHWAIRWKPTGAFVPGHLDKPVLFSSEYRAWRFVEALRRENPEKAPPPVEVVLWTRPVSEGQIFERDAAQELILDLEQAAARRAFEGRMASAQGALRANVAGVRDLLQVTAQQGLDALQERWKAEGLPGWPEAARALLWQLIVGAAWRGFESGYGLAPHIDAWIDAGGPAGLDEPGKRSSDP